jgi:hypothetical protein
MPSRIYNLHLHLQISSLVNILDRDTRDLAEEFIDLPRDEQLDRISDLRILVKTIKQISDEAAGSCLAG